MSTEFGRKWIVRMAVVAGTSVTMVGAFVGSAAADVDTVVRNGIAEKQSGGNGRGGGGDIVIAAEAATGVFVCIRQWVPVVAAPSGYVTGNCAYNVELHRQVKAYYTTAQHTAWEGGKVFGNYNGCGWVGNTDSSLTRSGTFYNCDPNSIGMRLDEFAQATNDGAQADGYSCEWNSSAGCTDGTGVAVTGICYAYANFRPWVSGQQPTDYLRYYTAGQTLRWRYITKFAQSGGAPWVMVKEHGRALGTGNWFFVPRACLTSLANGTLPGQRSV